MGRHPLGRWTGFRGKTLWDWLQLLIIPLVLAALAFSFNYFESERDRRRENAQQARQETLAAERAREDALQAYLRQMSDLLLVRRLGTSRPGSDVQEVARGLTLTVVRQLDAGRKGLVVRFLHDARLLSSRFERVVIRDELGHRKRVRIRLDPPVTLADADLRGVRLDRSSLISAEFVGADLRDSHFREAAVGGSNFQEADLRGADFRGASFFGGFVSAAGGPRRLAFGRARIDGACVTGTNYGGADLTHTIFNVIGRNVELSGADLTHADLRRALLRDVRLDDTRMTKAKLPEGWGDTGLPVSRERVDAICVIPPTGYDPETVPP